MSTENRTKGIVPCRLSYAHLWEADSVNGSEPKYSVSCIIDKKDKDMIAKIRKAIETAKEEGKGKWGGGNAALYIKEVLGLERWKDIERMEGKYQVSGQGRIRCMPRYVKCRGGYVRHLPMKVLELKYDEVLQIKRMLAGGIHPYEIAEKMGISRKMVSKIKSGRSYAWLN